MEHSRSEEGMVMVEAVYVVVIAIMIIFFTVNIGVIFHNRIVITSVANEAAAGVAANYGNIGKEPFFNYTGEKHFYESNPYRYWRIGKNSIDNVAEKKAKWYAGYLLSEMEFATDEVNYSGITAECNEDTLGKYIIVSITRTYDVFVVNPFYFFNLNPKYEIKAEGRAICYDIIHQMNSIALRDELESKLDDISILDNILNIIEKLMGLWKSD